MPPPGDRLESWKEIAAFLNKGVRTVQRWERAEGLPVHRHMHDRQGTVYALRSELETWWANRSTVLEPATPPSAPAPALSRFHWRWAAAGAVVVLALAGWRLTAEAGSDLTLGEATPFTSAPGFEHHPSFSPDGQFVVYSATDGKSGNDLYVQAVGRGEPQRLTSDPTHEVSPAWSLDGRSIAYIRAEAKTTAEIMVQPAVRGTARKIADLQFHGQGMPMLAWSSDSEWLIAADKPSDRDLPGLFRIRAATGERQRLTTTCKTCLLDTSMALSPDGREIAFIRQENDGRRDVWAFPVDQSAAPRGEPRRVTELNAFLGAPVWLPGTRDLAFPLLSDFSWTWKRVGRFGVQPYDSLARVQPRPVFSADGRYLIAPDERGDHDIRRLDLVTGEERDLIVSTRIETNAQISPDGKQIVFPSSRRGGIDLWKASADGSHPVQLISVPGKSCGTPRWSPDGKQIAFDIADSQGSDIYVMNADGGQVRRLTDHLARDFVPSWSRDGQWIYFGSDRDGTEIWRIPARGGDPVKVTRHGGFGAWESEDRAFLYVAKMVPGKGSRSPGGIWRVRLSDGTEEPIPEIKTDWSRYAVREDGIYFIGAGPQDCHTVRFYDFKKRTVRDIRKLDRISGMGFSVAPDGKWLVYTNIAQRGSDLLLYAVHRR